MYVFESNFDSLFNVLFWCNFDQIPVLMDWKLTQLWHAKSNIYISMESLEEVFISIKMQTYKKYLLKFLSLIAFKSWVL